LQAPPALSDGGALLARAGVRVLLTIGLNVSSWHFATNRGIAQFRQLLGGRIA
jgi:hypothetical protein